MPCEGKEKDLEGEIFNGIEEDMELLLKKKA